MPVRHIVLLAPKPETSQTRLEGLRERISHLLQGFFPSASAFAWGRNIADPERQRGFSIGFSMDFPTVEELKTYDRHPSHLPIKKDVAGCCQKILAFDMEIG